MPVGDRIDPSAADGLESTSDLHQGQCAVAVGLSDDRGTQHATLLQGDTPPAVVPREGHHLEDRIRYSVLLPGLEGSACTGNWGTLGHLARYADSTNADMSLGSALDDPYHAAVAVDCWQ